MAEITQRSNSPETSISVPLSIEQERDSYKEKVEHMKLLIRQYQQELQTKNIRKEGMETVTKLLQEAKQENANLKKMNRTLDTAVRNLQSRLKSNGLSGNISTEETDVFIPGTSKQLLDNLARENSRLRTLLKGASLDPEEVLQLRQALNEKSQEIEDIQKSLKNRNDRILELEYILNASDSEKDAEIKKLQDDVQELRESFRTRVVLCSSLAEETKHLRQQLHDVAVRCQHMAQRLEQNNKEQGKNASDSQTKISGNGSEDMERLKEENFNLHNKLEEVTKMNHRWQSYNNTQEERIKQLEQELETVQEYSVTPEKSETINRALDEAKQKLQNFEYQKHQLQQELEESRTLVIQQSEEMEKIRMELATSRQNGSQTNSNAETIEALRAQIQICTEDFESERSDREKAQNKISQLEDELQQVKRERDALNRNHQQHVNVEQNFLTNQELYNDFALTPANHGYPYENQLAARGPTNAYVPLDANEVDSNLQIDAAPRSEIFERDVINCSDKGNSANTGSKDFDISENKSKNGLMTNSDLGLSLTVPSLNDLDEMDNNGCISGDVNYNSGSQVLTCPNCQREFKPEKHSDLVEHLEICM